MLTETASTSSNSPNCTYSKDDTTQPKASLKVDKLTLLIDLPGEECGHAVSYLIGHLTDQKGCASGGFNRAPGKGFKVAIAGRVPVSDVPRIWSKETAYHLQVGPKRPGVPAIRLDLNPVIFTTTGLEYLKDCLEGSFGIKWVSLAGARVSRVDAALDLHGIKIDDWIWDMPQRKKRHIINNAGRTETIYLGDKKSRPMVIYDKATQAKLPVGNNVTRIEYRSRGSHSPAGLLKMPCPFDKLTVSNAATLPLPPPARAMFAGYARANGISAALDAFPVEARKKFKAQISASRPSWWNPATIWATWPDVLRSTLPILFEPKLVLKPLFKSIDLGPDPELVDD